MTRLVALLPVVLVLLGPAGLAAQSPRMVRVQFDFRQDAVQRREGVEGGGRVIITDRGSARPQGRAGVESTQRKTQQTTGVFTLVQDGGESTLLIASQVPYPQVAWYRDYLTGAGYVATGVQFRDVGTSLKVRADILPGNQVKVRLTPSVTWFAGDGSGAIEVREAATDLVLVSGQPMILGGATTQTHDVLRRVLGFRTADSQSETLMRVTATIW
jgi:hypothetical protein